MQGLATCLSRSTVIVEVAERQRASAKWRGSFAIRLREPAAWLQTDNPMGREELGTAIRFPTLRAPNGGYLATPIPAVAVL